MTIANAARAPVRTAPVRPFGDTDMTTAVTSLGGAIRERQPAESMQMTIGHLQEPLAFGDNIGWGQTTPSLIIRKVAMSAQPDHAHQRSLRKPMLPAQAPDLCPEHYRRALRRYLRDPTGAEFTIIHLDSTTETSCPGFSMASVLPIQLALLPKALLPDG